MFVFTQPLRMRHKINSWLRVALMLVLHSDINSDQRADKQMVSVLIQLASKKYIQLQLIERTEITLK